MHTTRKRFGQHFLHDKQVIQHIVDAIQAKPGDHIVEIGPGQGALTVPLLKQIGQLEAIEIDYDLIPALKRRCADKGNLVVHQADVLEFDFGELALMGPALRIIGNLPYNISTPLIFHLLTFARDICDMHFMLQKEVVDRMAAKANESAYGRLSIMIQYHCEVTALFSVPPSAFYPPPQVNSSVVRLVPRPAKSLALDYENFSYLVREAFNHRRKTLRNCLKAFMTDEDWQKVGLDAGLRPEQLKIEEYVSISNYLTKSRSLHELRGQ